MAIGSSGILERPADQVGLTGSVSGWLQPGRPPARLGPWPADAAPAPSEWDERRPASLPAVGRRAAAGTRPSDLLAAWRVAERELAATRHDGPEWSARAATVAECRGAYHRLFEECRGPREIRDPSLVVALRALWGGS